MKEGIDSIIVMLTPKQAQLLTAATAMYRALQPVADETPGMIADDVLEVVRQAIAKAEGRAA